MFVPGPTRTLLTATVSVAVAFWSASAFGQLVPDDPPEWWGDPDAVTLGLYYDDDSLTPRTDPDLRPPWCDESPVTLEPEGDVVWFDMGGDIGGVWGIPADQPWGGKSGVIKIPVPNWPVRTNKKKVFVEIDIYQGHGTRARLGVSAPGSRRASTGRKPTAKSLGCGWWRCTYECWLIPQPEKEYITITYTTAPGSGGSVAHKAPKISTKCFPRKQTRNHSEGHSFGEPPFAPPTIPEPLYVQYPPWYEGTVWACVGRCPEWMDGVTDHQGVVGIPPQPAPQTGEIYVTLDGQFDEDDTEHLTYQYDRYRAGGDVFTEEVLPPGTIVENRAEELEHLDEGWERVRVSLDASPRPEFKTICFVLSALEPDEPVAIDNLIMSAGTVSDSHVARFGDREPAGPAEPGLPSDPVASWSENFDSYYVGTGMHGQGGWKGWDNDPNFDALVINEDAHSFFNSVDIVDDADVLHEFSGYTSGQYAFTAWQFVPEDFVGESYFVLLNTYNDGGPYNFSTVLMFDAGRGVVESLWEGATLPLVTGRWVRLRVEIDLDADVQTIYYDGQELNTKSWTEGLGDPGVLDIAAVDLYANGSSSIYYDDLLLRPTSGP